MKSLPITRFIDLKDDGDHLFIDISENIKNHIGSIHAAVMFTLAESASGYHLSRLYPELKDKVIPLLRESNMKYKKTAFGRIIAYSSCMDELQEKFFKQFLKKGRGTISVDIELKNSDMEIVANGSFTWFVQKIS
jgi:acyl-coenzyme A thioesterase PaaI-like protein